MSLSGRVLVEAVTCLSGSGWVVGSYVPSGRVFFIGSNVSF
jgi:hypothetical protein